ncbi:glycosyltransferase family 2 protein [uncultured Proteiniphilum sp.]|uniref:glycosyltransferase family 2 protein n=1 Tax=uncultured Proteiniphilum sp. TaxID=497637 RepID=UPI00260E0CC7|nr:glycosyltransferase family 2 protein [uncultured Proteiniphilum sp.]
MKQSIEISIITVNYNGIKDTAKMIESVQSNLSIPYEIIVVDNGSKRDESLLLEKGYPFIKTIRSEKNLGFAGGNNLGIRQAVGNYLFFLNNDTVLRDNSLHYLVETMQMDPKIGGASPKILFNDACGHIQFAGYTPLSEITIRNQTIGFNESDNGQYDTLSRTPYLHGAAMLVKREVIEKVGLMPECYFLYYEELDWSTQITKAGYELVYEPRACIYHSESNSTGKESPLKIYYLTRNRLLYTQRNRTRKSRTLSIAYQVLVAYPKNVLKFVIRLKIPLAKACIKGCMDFFRIQNVKPD